MCDRLSTVVHPRISLDYHLEILPNTVRRDRSFVLSVETVSLSMDDILVGAMQFARLAFAGVLATADPLDHYGPPARFFDGFDRLTLAGGDVLAVLEELVDPVLEGA